MARKAKVGVGDRVKYSRDWLRSAGAFTGPLGFARGTVREVKTYGAGFAVATVDWGGDPDIPERVNVANLARADALEVER